MAIGIANFTKATILNAKLGGQALSVPTTVYVALLTDASTDIQRAAGTLTEVTTANWTNYARVATVNNLTNWPFATTDSTTGTATKQNGAAVTFTNSAVVSGVGPTVTGFALFDHPTATAVVNLIAAGGIGSGGGQVLAGMTVTYDIGNLVVQII